MKQNKSKPGKFCDGCRWLKNEECYKLGSPDIGCKEVEGPLFKQVLEIYDNKDEEKIYGFMC